MRTVSAVAVLENAQKCNRETEIIEKKSIKHIACSVHNQNHSSMTQAYSAFMSTLGRRWSLVPRN